jgi:aryl carrier-like protein
MKPEMIALLKDLASVLEKHGGGLGYKTSDDGVHVYVGDEWTESACIGWPMCGNVEKLREIIDMQERALKESHDTPRTDDEENRIQSGLNSMRLDDWNDAYHEMKKHAQELEREIIDMQERGE